VLKIKTETNNAQSKAKNLLIVDDVENNLILLEDLLTDSGYNVVSAINGKDALEKLHAEKDYDLIISDVLMPVMDGFMLCKEMKKDEKLHNIPLIFYTASYISEKDEAFALKLGADKFIRKPIEPDEFLKIVQYLLKDVGNGKRNPQEIVSEDDGETLKLYNERLVEKLQTKVLALEHEIIERKSAEEKLAVYQTQLKHISSALSLAEERERRKIAEDLHDRIGQNQAVIKIKLEELSSHEVATDSERVMKEARELLDKVIQDTRTLIFEISPPILYQLGYEPALEWLIEQFRERHNIPIEYKVNGDGRALGDDVSFFLFKSVRELLFNVIKHAKADTIKILVQREKDEIRISIEDDGIGFDFSKVQFTLDKLSGFGLFSIRERMAFFGGNFVVESKPSQGTCITLVMPLKRQKADRRKNL